MVNSWREVLNKMAEDRGYSVRIAQFEDGQTLYLYGAFGLELHRISLLWDEGSVIEAGMEWLAGQEAIRER
jgi:hypothetical protein